MFAQVMTALGIVTCYVMGRSLAWNWLSLGALIFLVPFTFGLYYIPESPPWLVYNDEEDLAFKSMSQIRGEEYDATCEIEHFKVRYDLPEKKHPFFWALPTFGGEDPHCPN